MSSEESEIEDIESIDIPLDWFHTPVPEAPGGRSLDIFQPLDGQEISFMICKRTLPLSSRGSRIFQNTLYSPFHEITRTELKNLHEVLGAMSNQKVFQTVSAGTAYIDGRRTIQITGFWLETRQINFAVFVDRNGDGVFVNEYIITADETVEDCRFQAERIFSSIIWKKENKHLQEFEPG